MMEYHIIERFLRHTLVHITMLQYSTRPMAIDSYIINLNLVPTRRIYRFLYYRLKLSLHIEFKILSRRTGIKESYLDQEKSQTVSR